VKAIYKIYVCVQEFMGLLTLSYTHLNKKTFDYSIVIAKSFVERDQL